MCGQNSNAHLNSVVKPVCLPIFCCRIFILFAIWDPKSWFKAVCDQKSLILCRYRTRITLNNRVMWTVSDLSLPVSIASRFPPGPLEAEWSSIRTLHRGLLCPCIKNGMHMARFSEPMFTIEDVCEPYQAAEPMFTKEDVCEPYQAHTHRAF